jgi:4-amino-4-deoxy-L-arabinose transferase-like glycosyltransferase
MATRKQYTPIIFLSLLLLAAFLRLYRLDSVPPSPSLDEVSLGYNAYAIAQTGADEYGTKYPLLLRAYDDYRPALYVYPVALFTKFLGITVLAVRLPSVLFSLVTLYIVYLAASLLGEKFLKDTRVGLWTLGLAAISPWHIYISRLGHEVNLGLMLTTWGVYLLLVWALSAKAKYLYGSAVVLALSLYAYQSQKLVVPAFLVCVGLVYGKRLIQQWKVTAIAGLLFTIVVLPAVIVTLSPQGMSRLSGTSAIGADTPAMHEVAVVHAQKVAAGDRVGAILTSKYVSAARIAGSQYLAHFAPGWLFAGSQRESHKIPYTGLLYWWEAVLLAAGIWYIWKRLPREVSLYLAAWVLTGPLPAAITTQAPHAMRAFTAVAPLMVIEGLGLYALLQAKRYRVSIAVVVLILGILSTYQMHQRYFITFRNEQSDSFQYALKDALSFARAHEDEYQGIHITNSGAGYQSYMFFLYYSKFDVHEYRQLGGTVSGGYDKEHTIGKYTFGKFEKGPSKPSKTLYIIEPQQLLPGMQHVAEFKNLDDRVVLLAVSW